MRRRGSSRLVCAYVLQRLELESYSYEKARKKPSLTLVWAASTQRPQSVTQTITLFTSVVCRLIATNEPMKWIVRTVTFIRCFGLFRRATVARFVQHICHFNKFMYICIILALIVLILRVTKNLYTLRPYTICFLNFYTIGLRWKISQLCHKNAKSFPSHKAHRAALISVSLALSQTPVYTARPRIRG